MPATVTVIGDDKVSASLFGDLFQNNMLISYAPEELWCEPDHLQRHPVTFRIPDGRSGKTEKPYIGKFPSKEIQRAVIGGNDHLESLFAKDPDQGDTAACMANSPIQRTYKNLLHNMFSQSKFTMKTTGC